MKQEKAKEYKTSQLGISVLMPVYNSLDTLPRSIESILQQTYKNFEFIIVVECGSEDGVSERVEQYAKNDARIRMIQNQKREGLSESLNIGIRAARGKYIARMDADDYSYPGRLEREWEYMETHPECVLCASSCRMLRGGHESFWYMPSDPETIKARLLFQCAIPHPTVMLRRSVFMKNSWYYSKDCIAEDFELWSRIDGNIGSVPDILVDYYTTSNNRSSTIERKSMMQDVCNTIKKQIRNKLQIDTRKYDDYIYLPDLQSDSVNMAEDLCHAFLFLKEIEESNREIFHCNSQVLAEELCRQWNHFLWEFFIIGGNSSKIGMPWLTWKEGRSFQENLTDCLREKIPNIETAIHRNIKKQLCAREGIGTTNRVIVYGVGIRAQRYFAKHPETLERVQFFCDSSFQNQGKTFLERKIVSPQELHAIDYDWIVVTTEKFFMDIFHKLTVEYRVPGERIASIGFLKLNV